MDVFIQTRIMERLGHSTKKCIICYSLLPGSVLTSLKEENFDIEEDKQVRIESVLGKDVNFPAQKNYSPREDVVVVNGEEISFQPGAENEIPIEYTTIKDYTLEIILPIDTGKCGWRIFDDGNMTVKAYENISFPEKSVERLRHPPLYSSLFFTCCLPYVRV